MKPGLVVVGRSAALVLVACLAAGAGGANAPAAEPSVLAPLAARSLLLHGTSAGDHLVVVGERGHILLSRDGGTSWQQVVAPTRTMLTAVAFADARTGCAVGHDEAIVCTWDGGDHWELVHFAPEEEQPLLTVLFLDQHRGFAAGAYGVFLETSDGGRSWQGRRISEDDLHFNHLALAAGGRVFLAAESGVILRSDDAGLSWHEVASPYHGSFFGTLPLAGDAVLAFGLRGNLFRSDDAGETWRELESNTEGLLTHGTVLGDGTVVISALGGGVLVSRDGGRSFGLHQLEDRKGIAAVLESATGQLVRLGEGGVQPLVLPVGGWSDVSESALSSTAGGAT